MINITFGIFSEDAANDIFIKNAIPQLVSHFGFEQEIFFSHYEDFTQTQNAINGQYVKEHFIKHVLVGIKNFGLELCFVGLDADDEDYLGIYNNMHEKLSEVDIINFALIFIPVQAIEYWLWYLKVKIENPDLENTPIIDRIKDRKEMKRLVYNRKRPTNKKSNPIVVSLTENIDFDWLVNHSTSFGHFYQQFERYIRNKLPAKEEE